MSVGSIWLVDKVAGLGNRAVSGSPPNLAGQARPWWLLFPVGAHVDLVASAAALGADHMASEVGDFSFGRVAPYIDQRRVSAGIVQTGRDQPLHP
jgi:hypothetical protein